MKKYSTQTWLTALAVTLVAAVYFTVTGWLLATPAQDISHAVNAAGADNVAKASADTFIDAFATVLVGVDENQTKDYVAAAEKLRPDLKGEIDSTVAEVSDQPTDTKTDCHRVSGHRHVVKICCNGHTIILPVRAARHYLACHPRCHRGVCHHHWT